jgi:hypothetical protein
MTTTDIFQKIPDYFKTEDECKLSKFNKEKDHTNSRYPSFTQVHFTAGDIDQFYSYKDETNGSNPNPLVNLENNDWKESDFSDMLKWPSYKNINTESVNHTFRYMFEKFKKGVFIKIKNNKLSVFLPFSKHNYTNEWGGRMKVDPKWKMDMSQFLLYTSRLQDPKFSTLTEKSINKFPYTWYANNCLIRPEHPTAENDRGLSNMKDMLISLCETREIPDIELFINKRDFPLLKINDTEPYEHIFDSENIKLVSHSYDKYCPILSSVTTDKNADIPFPTAEDWARASNQEDGKFFTANCQSYKYDFNQVWSSKKPAAVFRGSSTGCGTTIEDNPRLKISWMSWIEGKDVLDAGITTWNMRPRKIMGVPYLQIIQKETLPFWNDKTDGLVSKLTPQEQSNYKYIVNIDGHVSAFRLSLELSMGSVILLVESKYRMWFRKYLVEYVHYVPVKGDLSDLFEKIEWCRSHDDECQKIANNAKQFYERYLTKKGLLDYVQKLFITIKQTTGSYFYNTINVGDVISIQQLKIIKEIQTQFYDTEYDPTRNIVETAIYPFKTRNVYAMDGLQSFIREQDGLVTNDGNMSKVHSSKDTNLFLTKMDEIYLSFKKTDRRKENINESFCGITSINKLLYDIPNFKYTFFLDKNNTLISEHIVGKTFKDYINDGCTLSQLCNVLIMICMALAVAQEKIGFVHYDLYPWNIIITNVKRQKIAYQFKEYLFEVETDVIPVIIDYGKSHVIYEDLHYGTLDPFKMSTIQDCFCIIISSVVEFVKKQQTQADINVVYYLVNFFSSTEFQVKNVETYQELMSFLTVHKKYNEMIYRDKCDLERKDPCELLFYLLDSKKIPYTTKIYQVNYPRKIVYNRSMECPLFYYDIITQRSDDVKDVHMADYILYLSKTFLDVIDKTKDILLFTDICNATRMAVFFLKGVSSDRNKHRLDELLKLIDDTFKIKSKTKKTQLDIGYINTHEHFSLAKYNVNTFSIPEKILTLIQSHRNVPKKNKNLISLRDTFISNLFYDVYYKIPNEQEFCRKYSRIIHISPIIIFNYNANVNTLNFLSKKIYKKDKKELEKLTQPPVKTIQTLINILASV